MCSVGGFEGEFERVLVEVPLPRGDGIKSVLIINNKPVSRRTGHMNHARMFEMALATTRPRRSRRQINHQRGVSTQTHSIPVK